MPTLTSPWLDVSIPLRPGMAHWPGNTPFDIARDHDMSRGHHDNVSRISLSVHSGTHMDAPLHFFANGDPMETLPFEAVMGPARVIEIEDAESIKVKELEGKHIAAGERILFKTANSARVWKTNSFVEDFVYISKEAAKYLVEKKILTVGVDYLSVGGFHKDGLETHRELLGGGVWIIEGLNLEEAGPGNYELVCLPLRLADAEGSPARALVRKES